MTGKEFGVTAKAENSPSYIAEGSTALVIGLVIFALVRGLSNTIGNAICKAIGNLISNLICNAVWNVLEHYRTFRP
jgi:choline-glycine betaine transporter